ncbi:MAG TPA: anti-sigma factor [Thermoanaerobaculia bacterium]
MRCDEMDPLLGPFLDGELAGDEAEAVRRHLATCPGCRDRLAGLAALETAVRGLRPERAPGGLDAVLARARSAAPPPPGSPGGHTGGRRRLRQYLAVAATLALLVAGGVWIAVDRAPVATEPESSRPATGDPGVMDPGSVECLRPEDCGPTARPLWPPVPI